MKFLISLAPKNPTDRIFSLFDLCQKNNIKIVFVGNPDDDEQSFKKVESFYKNFYYLSVENQNDLFYELSQILPFNDKSRLNIGSVYAKKSGATIVFFVDLDGETEINYLCGKFLGKTFIDQETFCWLYSTPLKVFDPYAATNYLHQWFRGFPWDQLCNRNTFSIHEKHPVAPTVQTCLIDGSSDVDMLGRLLFSPENKFRTPYHFVTNAYVPFNCHNTGISAGTLQDYFIFPIEETVGDIIGSYIYQQKYMGRILYCWPTVTRNEKKQVSITDVSQDIADQKLIKTILSDITRYENVLPEKSIASFEIYKKLMAE